jgi:hypothetical protein
MQPMNGVVFSHLYTMRYGHTQRATGGVIAYDRGRRQQPERHVHVRGLDVALYHRPNSLLNLLIPSCGACSTPHTTGLATE